MESSLFYTFKLVLCLLCTTTAFYDNTENFSKDGGRYPLEIDQISNLMRRDVITPENSFVLNELQLGQENTREERDEIKNKENRNRQYQRFNSRRRCFLGYPYDCSTGFLDPLLEWSSQLGWTPGPLYPEYGPNFNRGWMGRGVPFGYNHCGCGGPWNGPGCCCGCSNNGWFCKSCFYLRILKRTLI